jgi:transposase
VEQWAEIRRLHSSEKLSIKEIVRKTGYARNTVRAAIRSTSPPKYERSAAGSLVDAFEPEIRRLLSSTPAMPGSVIAERIDWPGGMTVLYDRLRELRPQYLPQDPAGRTTYEPGEIAQWDLWFPPADIPLEDGTSHSPPVIVGTCGYSRYVVGEMIPTRTAHDLLCGHWNCLVRLGAVPQKGVYDGESALSSRKGVKVTLTDPFQAFRGTLGMGVIILRPKDPESKGIVERHNGYFETSFLPGRTFESPQDFNAQFNEWLDTRANVRVHATLRERPIDRLEADKASMMPLPPVAPDPSLQFTTRLACDHWVRVDTCDYSVDPRFIGYRVNVKADHVHVNITGPNGENAGVHKRSWARHRTVTDPAHVATGDQMRAAHREAKRIGLGDIDVEIRDLSVYDSLGEES